jgi:hypothetical protein
MFSLSHRVDRVLGFFSSRPNWVPPTQIPHPQAGGGHSLAEGGEGPIFGRGEGTETVKL